MRSAGAALYLQDVALLDGGVLQLAGLLLQSLGRAADWQTGQYLLWQPEGALTLLHGHHLLLEPLHFHQETLQKKECRCDVKLMKTVFFFFRMGHI